MIYFYITLVSTLLLTQFHVRLADYLYLFGPKLCLQSDYILNDMIYVVCFDAMCLNDHTSLHVLVTIL